MPVIRRKELERLEIPLPSLETQQWIGELQALKKAEQDLMGNLAKQKEILAEAVCMNLIEGENQ
jgi:restriction endonuclease S subunit